MDRSYQMREPRIDELHRLAEIGRETFVETFGHMYSSDDLNDFLNRVHCPQSIAREMENERIKYRVITNENEWIAYCKIGPVLVPVENPSGQSMELRQLYVRKPWIGKGLGSLLMDWAIAEFQAAQVDDLYVSVFSENSRAIRFYESYGFKKIGEYGFKVGKHIDHEWILHQRLHPQSL